MTESGSGTGVASASRSFGYDLAGLRTSVSHPGGTLAYAYDDRGLMTAAAGPAGSASFAYDAVGRLTSRTDPAGTHTFAWTDRGELDSAAEPLTGTALDYVWDAAGQLDRVDLPSGAVRDYAFDPLGRLTEDVLKDPSETQTARLAYGYDDDSNVTSQTIEIPGNPAAGTHSYSYDRAGRIASWTAPGASPVDYTFDAAGNRTAAGQDTYLYDERNRLMEGPGEPILPPVGGLPQTPLRKTYTYTPRGTLAAVEEGVQTDTYDFDALGRLTGFDDGAPVAYTYDSLDRIATRGAAAFTYAGTMIDPVSDGAFTYSRTPGGHLLGLSDGTTDLLAGTNRHGDLAFAFSPGGVVSLSKAYDPFGEPTGSTGTIAPSVGYQGDYTDPATADVWMGARWCAPDFAAFTSRDSVFGNASNPVSLNRYTYAFADPMEFFDPDGRMPLERFGGTPSGGRDWLVKTDGGGGSKCNGGCPKAAPGGTSNGSSSSDGAKTAGSHDAKLREGIPINGKMMPVPAGWDSWDPRMKTFYISTLMGPESVDQWIRARSGRGYSSMEELFTVETAKYAWHRTVNFGRGLVDGTTRTVTLGLWGTKLGPKYREDDVESAYGGGYITGSVQGFLGGGALLRGGLPALGTPARSLVSLSSAGLRTRGITAGAGASIAGGAEMAFNPKATPGSVLRAAAGGGVVGYLAPGIGVSAPNTAGRAAGLADDGVNVIPSSGRTFVVTPKGTVYDVPQGWAPRVADNGRGIVYQRPGAPRNADSIRIMEPTSKYPSGYARYYNSGNQPLDVFGNPGPDSVTHIPQDYMGPWPGWPQ